MTPVSTINLRIKITPTIPVADLRVRVTPPHSGPFDPLIVDPDLFDVGWKYNLQPHIDISVDDDLSASIFPRVSREQVISPFVLSLGGTDIPYYRRLPEMTVSESIDGISSFSFSMPRRNNSDLDPYMEPIGQPKAWLGVPGGKQSVDISAVYNTESGQRISIPIIKNGLLDNSSSQINLQSDIRAWNGGGAHARIDRKSITYQAPPGHGQKSSTVVRKILELAGVDSAKISVSDGRRMYKEISLIDAKPIESCNQILLPENRRLFHDSRTDTWTTVDYSGIEGKRVECIITESDILEAIGAFGDSEANDAPTSIVLTSTAQVTRDQCGRRTEYKATEIFSIRAIQSAHFLQEFGYGPGSNSEGKTPGSLTPMPWRGSEASLRLTSLIIEATEIDCETIISEEIIEWGWKSVKGARYIKNGDGSTDYYHSGYLYDSSASTDDSSPIYIWRSEKFVPILWRRSSREFSGEGYLIRTTTREAKWEDRILPIRDKDAAADGTPWSQILHIYASVTGDGVGVEHQNPASSFSGRNFLAAEGWRGPTSGFLVDELGTRVKVGLVVLSDISQVTVLDEDVKDGFIHLSSSSITSYIIRPNESGRWLYRSGEVSDDVNPVFILSNTQRTVYSAAGESRHNEFFTELDHNGSVINRKSEKNLDGYLPVADQRQDIVPPISFFDNPAEHEFALAASRHENRPIKVEISAPALESVMEPWQMKGVNVQYAENEQDLINLGTFMIRELSSIQIDYPLLLNALLRPGHRVILYLPSLGIYYDHIILNLQHTQSSNISYTQVTGRYDVI